MEHAGDAAAVFGHQRKARVGRIGITARLCDFREAHPLVLPVLRAPRASHHDAFPPTVFFGPGGEVFVFLDPLTNGRILQPLGKLRGSTFARPDGEERAPPVIHCRVGIFVRGDVEPAHTRVVDRLQVLADGAPIVAAANLEMEDVNRQLRLLGDTDRERQLLLLLEAFAADV